MLIMFGEEIAGLSSRRCNKNVPELETNIAPAIEIIGTFFPTYLIKFTSNVAVRIMAIHRTIAPVGHTLAIRPSGPCDL